MSAAESSERRDLERDVEALAEALHCPERVASRVLAMLDGKALERLRDTLLTAFKEQNC